MVRFANPLWMLMGVVALVPLLTAARAHRRGRSVSLRSVLLQVLAVLLLVLGLARPGVQLRSAGVKPWLILRDVSASTRTQNQGTLELPEDIPFDPCDFAASLVPANQMISDDRTLITPGLRLGLSRRSELSGLIIHTDGRFSEENWGQLADALGRTRLPVAIVPMESPPPDVRIAGLSIRRRTDTTASVRVTVTSNARVRRELVISREGNEQTPLFKQVLDLGRESVTIRLRDDLSPDRGATYRAVLGGRDAFGENDAMAGTVLPLRGNVAFIAPADIDTPPGLVDKMSVPVRRIEPSEAPHSHTGWSDYSAVILVDSHGELLYSQQRRSLAGYVRGGGGLLLIGAGPHHSPADREDPLNEVSALLVNPYERKPLKVIVVLDASGSMGEAISAAGALRDNGKGTRGIKFDLARESVLSLRRHLTASDELSVIVFSDSASEVYDSGEGPIDLSAINDALIRVRGAGPTNLAEGLKLATERPTGTGKDGLVLVVSDLRTSPFDPAEMVERFHTSRFSLAVVAVTRDVAPSVPSALETLTRALDAPLVRRGDLVGLGEVFARFLHLMRGEAVRGGFFTLTGRASCFGADTSELPALRAYMLSAPLPGADVLLSIGDDPLLARRTVSLGRSVSLCAPMDRSENSEWAGSRAVNQMLGGAVQWILRPQLDTRFVGEFRRTGDELHLVLNAEDADAPMNLLKLTACVQPAGSDSGDPGQFALRQIAPGIYEADIPVDADSVSASVTDSQGRVVWRGASPGTYPREFARMGADWTILRELGRRTGGRIVSQDELASFAQTVARGGWVELWYCLVAGGLLLMLLEWVTSHGVTM